MNLLKLICKRCGYGYDPECPWVARVEHPAQCPGCKSAKWDTARKLNEKGRKPKQKGG